MTGASATLINDTFFANTSDNHGGGLAIMLSDSTGQDIANASLTSLTVNQNTAATDSGGMYISTTLKQVVSADNSIFDGNFVTANGYQGPIDVTLSNNNNGWFKTLTYNLVGTSDTMFPNNQNGNKRNNTTGLANALAQNGAPANYPLTLALSNVKGPNSPGYETGDPTLAGAAGAKGLDERGFKRQANKVSIGAYDPDATAQ